MSGIEPAVSPLLHARRSLRVTAGVLLWLLLAGYMIINRPFAGLGFPPLYIGEMVLFACIAAVAGQYRTALLEPLRHSWPHRLIAIFFVYTLLRLAIDLPSRGFLAARDSVIGGYAMLAFLAPPLWQEFSPKWLTYDAKGRETIVVHVWRFTLPIAILAALWAAGIRFFYIDFSLVPTTKIDFLTIAAVLALWLTAMTAVQFHPFREFNDPVQLGRRAAFFIASGTLAYLSARLLLELPTRSLWLTPGPLAAIVVLAWAYDRQRKAILGGLAGVVLIAGLAFGVTRAGKLVASADSKYALREKLDFSIDELEAELKRKPDNFEKFSLTAAMTGVGDAAERERIKSLFGGSEGEFTTEQGRQSSHSLEWRAVFWSRSLRYMLHNDPLFGVGFGVNLTNLLRNTSAWPMFIPSMSLEPPNRSPHSAHVTIAARLGLAGALLWIAIVLSVLYVALRACWRYRRLAGDRSQPPDAREHHRQVFWSGVTVLGVWLIFLWAMTFNVVLENPFGGMWFWSMTGVLIWWALPSQKYARAE